MRGVRFISLAMAALVLVVLACGPNGAEPTLEVQPTQEAPPTKEVQPTPEVAPTEAPQPTPPPPPEDTPIPESPGAILEITNDSSADV